MFITVILNSIVQCCIFRPLNIGGRWLGAFTFVSELQEIHLA